MSYQLPNLPYAYDALEPHIDARTMEIHHTKHHNAYVTNLNKVLAGHDLGNPAIEDLVAAIHTLPEEIQTSVRNNGGGHANHSLFWEIMSGRGGGRPTGELFKAIEEHLGGFEKFFQNLKTAALGQFGSGWAWLSLNSDGRLLVESTPNQDSPLMHGNVPILGVDVWEHAYYLKYQNRRADYVDAFWNVVNWDAVSRRYVEAVNREVALATGRP